MNNILIVNGNAEVQDVVIKSLKAAGFEVSVTDDYFLNPDSLQDMLLKDANSKELNSPRHDDCKRGLSPAIAPKVKQPDVLGRLSTVCCKLALKPENDNQEYLLKFSSIFPESSCPLLNKVFQYIEENYRQDICVSDVAQFVGYSNAYLTNLVKRQTKKGIYGWIIERRMSEACSLLLRTNESVNYVAAKVGYPDTSHFTRHFRQIYNLSPKAWRDTYSVQLCKS